VRNSANSGPGELMDMPGGTRRDMMGVVGVCSRDILDQGGCSHGLWTRSRAVRPPRMRWIIEVTDSRRASAERSRCKLDSDNWEVVASSGLWYI